MRALATHAEMNQAAFFQAGDDFQLPSGGGAHPVEESAAVAGVAQSAGSDDPHAIDCIGLDGTMKAPQHAQRQRHGLRVECAISEDALAQTRDLAVFVQGDEPATDYLCDFQPD